MLKYLKYSLFLCFFFGNELYLWSQQYNFIRYSIQEGLPQSQVFAGIQDSQGYIWFGTQGGGISRFDGIDFENYTTKSGLPSNYINALLEDKKGGIWIGTSKGLCHFDGQTFRLMEVNDGTNINVHALFQQNDSTLWIGSGKGIYEYAYAKKKLHKRKIHPNLDNLGINAIYQSGQNIWVGSNGGVFQINKKTKRFTRKNGLVGNVVQSFLRDKNGLLWMASFDGGLSLFDEKKGIFLPFDNPKEVQKALVLHESDEGQIWVGTRNKGISIYHPLDSTWTQINEKKGLPHNHVRAIFKDSWQNTWVCTSGGGVAKYIGQFFVQYTASSGLHGKYVYALANDSIGNIWVSASNNGLANFDGYGFKNMLRDSGYLNVKSKSILTTQNDIWIGTEGKGIIKIDSLGQTLFTEKNDFPSNWIRNILAGKNGHIWVATHAKGIVKIEEIDSAAYHFTHFTQKTGLPDAYISALEKGNDNRIWFATQFGALGFFENGKIKAVFGKKEGLPDIAIRSIAFDDYGNIWLGTAGKGVYFAAIQSKPIHFKPIEMEKSLFSDNIYLLLFDPEGNLWAGSEAGVDKIFLNEASVVTDVQHFGRNEGFLGIETCQNAGLVDKDGNLWFGTMNGLMKHTPSQKMQSLSAPKIHFKSTSLFYQPLAKTAYKKFARADGGIKKGLALPHNKNHLNFEFKALNLSHPKGIQYRWRLLGSEIDWSPLSKKESVDYSNLPPGQYTFEVQAISGGVHFSDVISTGFSVKKPFWQLLWVQMGVGFLVLSILIALIFNGKRKIEKREAAKRAKLEMENHVLQLEQKALQLQMNPHFIFNALNSIQALVATKNFTSARTQINNFATLMRGILSNSKQQKITLAEEITVLQKYLQMEQFCQGVPFTFSITHDNISDLEEIEIPPMILQPFVENAVIHGIAHLQKEGQIHITFSLQNDLLVCEITDNGLGRKRAETLRQSRKPGHQSIAIDVTRERLDALKGTQNYVPLTTTDILAANGAVEGTKVVVRIPGGAQF